MRITCYALFERQYVQMIKHVIPLCKNPTNIYHLNLFRIVEIIYHLYIKYELYNLEYNKYTGFSMNANSYMEQWVSGVIIIHS